MLESHNVRFRYREYREEPLSEAELLQLFQKLDLTPRDALRLRDGANKELGLTGDEPPSRLIAAMAQHPTLLQRPIGEWADRAVIGRPPERLLELVEGLE